MAWILLLFVVGLLSATKTNVLQLTDETFEETIYSYDYLVVLFCGSDTDYCEHVGNMVSSAADLSYKRDLPLVFAAIDTKKNPIAQSVNSITTISFYRGHTDLRTTSTFTGLWSSERIVQWAHENASPRIVIISTKEELETIRNQHQFVLLAYLDDENSDFMYEMEVVATIEPTAVIVGTTNGSLDPDLTSVGSIVIYKSFDEGAIVYRGELSYGSIVAFLQWHMLPLVSILTTDNFHKMIYEDSDAQIILFGDPRRPYYSTLHDGLANVASTHQQRIRFIVAKSTDEDFNILLEKFHSKDIKIPFLLLINARASKNYLMDINSIDLIKLTTDEFINQLQFFIKSSANIHRNVIDDQTQSDFNPPDVLISIKTFLDYEGLILDAHQDVLLVYYDSSKCDVHCLEVVDIVRQVAREFAAISSIYIMRVDAMELKLDEPGIIDGLTVAIYFYPAMDKSSAIQYRGDVSPEALSRFLKKRAKKFAHGDGQSYGRSHIEL